jgi:nucleolar complex protein 2
LLKAIEHSAFEQHSLKALRRLVLAFKAASHMADESSRQAPGEQAFSIASSSVFDRLLVTCLTRLPDAFGHHLFQNPQYSALDPAPFAKLQGLPVFRSLRPALYRSLKALHYLLGQITEPSLLAFTLSRLERFLPFLVLFPRLAKFYLRTLLSLWAVSEALDVKLAAFLRVRQAATVLPFPFLEHCLKGAYLAYARNAKFVSEASLPGLTLMGNGLVELYGLDLTSAYQHAFVYVRQLALHLRAAYTKKTPEALQKVQCWQYLNCCKVWVAVLTAHVAPGPGSDKAPSQLRELVFPLAQILLGAVRLTPSARLYPLTLHCLTLLQRLAARAQVFIPCAAPCLSMLEDPALSKKPKPSTEAPPSLALALKLPGKAGLEAKNVQEALVDGCMDVLSQEILVYRYALAFPEYAYPIKDRLRRFAKITRNARWRALARGLVEECEKRGRFVERERARKEMAPTDAASLEALRPRGEGKGENKEDMDAAGRLKAFLDAKAAREGVGVEVLEVGAKKGSSGPLHGKEEAGEKRGREKKKGEAAESKTGRGANGKKEGKLGQQWQEAWEKIPVERMEDEVGALHEWSEDERESTGGDAEEEGEEEDDEDDEDEDEEDGDMEDGEEEEDDEGDDGDDGSSE